MDEYKEFLKRKTKSHTLSGFDVALDDLNKALFPFQKFCVQRALKAGKYAFFQDCGLGKTVQQLEWSNKVAEHTNGWVLILAPLAVKAQTIQEGKKFHIYVQDYFEAIGNNDIQNLTQGILIANYEQLENINCSIFKGIVLDESSILKNFEGATKKLILDKFAKTPYKLACTATPSPNDPMELGNHSEFLDVMSRNQMLAMYFVHDGGETAKWRIKGHAIKIFYQFVGSWAIMLNKPDDIGFPMPDFNLPSLNFIEKQIITPKRDNGSFFNDAIISAINFNAELRLTKTERLNEVVRIVNEKPDENFIIWVKQNEEGDALRKLLPDAVEVKGSDTNEYKEKMLLGFANNEFRILITKTKIASFGMNFQNCRNQIFPSLDFSFEGLYQAIRRSYRFGQKNQVNIYLITTDTMANVKQSIDKKQKQFQVMQDEMAKAIDSNLKGELMSETDFNIEAEENKWFTLKRGDCVQLIDDIPDNSLGLSVFSPPFAELYTYSSHVEDMGNSKDYNEFLIQFGFLVGKLYKKIMEGRNVAVHCMDLPIQKGKEGYIGLRSFSSMIITLFESFGFILHTEIICWKNPVTEMQRTKALGLLHKQILKDSTMSRVGIPDKVLVFRKDGERSNPVTHIQTEDPKRPCYMTRENAIKQGLEHKILNVDLWQKIASPVWMDIDYGNTLQGYRNGRDEKDEKHICPLSLDIIKNIVMLYSNKGDTVYTPFAGIGSEIYQSVKMGRIGLGHELKESYFQLAKNNCKGIVMEKMIAQVPFI